MQESTYRAYQRLPFDQAQCTLCGECLHRCPVMHLPLARAKHEMKRLVAGEETPVLRACTSCLACNLFRPTDSRPANLILDRWHALYLREGLSARAAYFLPHARPNFRTDIVARLPPDEREAVAGWRREEPAHWLCRSAPTSAGSGGGPGAGGFPQPRGATLLRHRRRFLPRFHVQSL